MHLQQAATSMEIYFACQFIMLGCWIADPPMNVPTAFAADYLCGFTEKCGAELECFVAMVRINNQAKCP